MRFEKVFAKRLCHLASFVFVDLGCEFPFWTSVESLLSTKDVKVSGNFENTNYNIYFDHIFHQLDLLRSKRFKNIWKNLYLVARKDAILESVSGDGDLFSFFITNKNEKTIDDVLFSVIQKRIINGTLSKLDEETRILPEKARARLFWALRRIGKVPFVIEIISDQNISFSNFYVFIPPSSSPTKDPVEIFKLIDDGYAFEYFKDMLGVHGDFASGPISATSLPFYHVETKIIPADYFVDLKPVEGYSAFETMHRAIKEERTCLFLRSELISQIHHLAQFKKVGVAVERIEELQFHQAVEFLSIIFHILQMGIQNSIDSGFFDSFYKGIIELIVKFLVERPS